MPASLTDEDCYQAMVAHDRRFDGVFFTAVTSTGIYCRPVCRVRLPRRKNCRFFHTAAAAEKAGYRPCLKCQPELAPGNAPADAVDQLAHTAASRIEAGALAEGESLETLANELGVTARHLRRSVGEVFGVSPVQLAQTHRLLTAKRLIAETSLPMTEVAYSSGFRSLRRFNALFKERYRLAPSELRRSEREERESLSLTLTYRPPLEWETLLHYCKGRAVPGVEWVTDDSYARTFRHGAHTGWLRVSAGKKESTLRVEVAHSLTPVLGVVLSRVRRAFDLDARPDLIAQHLGSDPALSQSVASHPGLRVPGSFDGYETAVRTLVGQQVSVAAATTVMARLGAAYGESITTHIPELHRLPLSAATMADLTMDDLAPRGLNRQRAGAILALSKAVAHDGLSLEPTSQPLEMMQRLQALPGIGPWSASYFAMRVLRWPDAFPAGDLGVRKALGGITERAAEERSQAWRPWRAYAVMHLWNSLTYLTPSSQP